MQTEPNQTASTVHASLRLFHKKRIKLLLEPIYTAERSHRMLKMAVQQGRSE